MPGESAVACGEAGVFSGEAAGEFAGDSCVGAEGTLVEDSLVGVEGELVGDSLALGDGVAEGALLGAVASLANCST